jgi:hypothetical protein
MKRNTITCSHCGKPFLRFTAETPVINRSFEKVFHLTLFSGPQPRIRSRGGFYPNETLCNFTYAHRRLDSNREQLVLLILRTEPTGQETLGLIGDAADKLAELLGEGKKLEVVYTFDAGQLVPGFPR